MFKSNRQTPTHFSDQTAFLDQAPLYEGKGKHSFSWREFKENKNLLPFYLLSAAIVLIIFLVLVFIFLANRPKQEEALVNRAQPSVDQGPLQQRVYELKQTLRDNDPTKQALPFPLVDLQFNIN